MICLTFTSTPVLGNTQGEKILKCVQSKKSRKIEICAIKTKKGKRGNVINFYNARSYWVASGVIRRKFRNHIIVAVDAGPKVISKKYKFKIADGVHWQNSFSAYDGW